MSDLIINRGDTRLFNVAITDQVGAVVDLSTATGLTFTVKPYGSTTAALTKTLGSGVAISNPTGGLATVTLGATDTVALAGQYAWDLQLTDVINQVSTVASGALFVVADVTSGTLAPPLITVGQMREYVTSGLTDGALQRLISLAESEVTSRIGAVGTAVEYIDGMTHRLVLSRPALSVTSIVETNGGTTSTTLAANDYVLRSPYVLERLTTGTNAASVWDFRVSVTYTPVDDVLMRQGVIIDLVRLTITRNPGLTSQQIGDWSESYSPYTEYDSEREAILCRLDPGPKMRIV